MYLARVAAERRRQQGDAGLTVNRLCGSGLQAIVSAAQSIMLGDADIAIGGGAESMSRGPYTMPAARFGQRMGDIKRVDMMVGALHDPFDHIHMGVTAENVAAKWGITRAGTGRARGREPPTGGCGDEGRPFQEPDRSGRGQGQEGAGAVRHRRAFPRRHIDRGHGEAEARVREGKRHRDRRQCVGHQRRRRRPWC